MELHYSERIIFTYLETSSQDETNSFPGGGMLEVLGKEKEAKLC